MNIQDLLNFEKFYSTIANTNLPLKTSYKINKIYQSISEDLEFYQAELRKILNDCGKFNENGELEYSEDGINILLQEDKTEEFGARFKELLNVTVDYNTNLNLDIEDLPDTAISPVKLMQIQHFIN